MKRAIVIAWLIAAGSVHAATEGEAKATLYAACPGLKTHAASLTWDVPVKQSATVNSQRDKNWKEVFLFKATVSQTPAPKLMSKFKAQGHSCYFEVDAQRGKEVEVSKSACQSICKDKAYGPGALAYFGSNGSEEIRR
ncbi:hypothetical protein [Polaromonas sp.]|uniref:hypothetical protein n=1 Tax=Polaromonas sp. TaxID=1869339 RepID=UPI0032671571